MRVLVTGGHGFLGRHVVALLEAENCAAALSVPTRRDLDAEGLPGLLRSVRPDHVFHLAGRLNGGEEEMRIDNEGSARRLFEALEEARVSARIVLAGSAAVYGAGGSRETPLDESAEPQPKGLYAETKFAAETHARRFAGSGGDVVIARISNPVGPGMGDHLLCGTLARQIVAIERGAQEPVLALRDLSPLRDFIHAADVAEGLVHLASHGASGEAYNVAAGTSLSAREMVELFLEEARVRPIEVRSTVAEASRSPMREQWLNTAKFRATGWRARRSVKAAVADLLKAQRAA